MKTGVRISSRFPDDLDYKLASLLKLLESKKTRLYKYPDKVCVFFQS